MDLMLEMEALDGKQEIQCVKIRIFNRGIQVGLEAGDLNEEI